jgi:hypothetical protein
MFILFTALIITIVQLYKNVDYLNFKEYNNEQIRKEIVFLNEINKEN